MRQGRLIELSDTLASGAARLSHEMRLPLADSIILYSARRHDAKLWTQDAHFKAVDGVCFVRKPEV
jgi:toxin FitB